MANKIPLDSANSKGRLSTPPGLKTPNSSMRSTDVGHQPATGNKDLGSCQCQCTSPHRRNLVVCIDGTANQFSQNNSNVVELYSRLVKSGDQLTYYNSGIGTYVKDSKSWLSIGAWKQSVDHAVDMAIAKNFKNKVLDAYQWLSENYEPDDRIFLFGFSRGAYQVRVIAGMIEKVGLLHKGNNQQIPFAYELYTKTTENEKRLRPIDPNGLCQRFKSTLSRSNVKVHFVGAWDTVSSIGIARGRSLPETTRGMTHVCAFRQALALDELRVKFLPEYVNGGDGPGASSRANVKEVWFVGSHSDIGGGNIPNPDLNRFGPSLRWMSYEAIRDGLKMEPSTNKWGEVKSTSSMTGPWKYLEYLPIHRLSYKDADSTIRWPPHRKRPRQMKFGQLIHESVFEEMNNGYTPKAHTCDAIWDKTKLQNLGMVEVDPYAKASHVLSRLENYEVMQTLGEQDVDALYNLASTGKHVGRQSITEYPESANLLIAALRAEILHEQAACQSNATVEDKKQQRVILTFVLALDAFKSQPYDSITHGPEMLRELWSALQKREPERQQTWIKFKRIFCAKVVSPLPRIDNRKLRGSLWPRALPEMDASYQGQMKLPCDPGTRRKVLDEIMNWVFNISDGSSSFLWLSGEPGVGKSAVAASIAKECKRRHVLWAQHFVNRNDARTNNPHLYFPSIIRQMSECADTVYDAMQTITQGRPYLGIEDISAQAVELFVTAVKVASESTPKKPIVIVIDALDETEPNSLKSITETFSRVLVDLPNNIKVLISSRVEDVIRDKFVHHSGITNTHMSTRTSVADVTQFLETKVHELITAEYLSQQWQDRTQKLCSLASGLFLWAATAAAFLQEQLEEGGVEEMIFSLDALNDRDFTNIDLLYMTVLKETYRHDTSPWQTDQFRRIVGAILAQQHPLPIQDLQGLLDLRNPATMTPVDVEHFVRRLRTVLVPGIDKIDDRTFPCVMHRSFVRFITGEWGQEFRVDMAVSHGELALQCINQLTRLLEGEVPGQLRYAISQWSSHLTRVVEGPAVSEWTVPDGMTHRSNSKARNGAGHPILVAPKPTDTKDRLNREGISSITCSPAGTCTAYGQGKNILLRDVVTGDFLGDPFTGHTDCIHTAAFSPDGKFVVSASDDHTIRIWDCATGKTTGRPLKGHTGSVFTAFFSPNGKRIVSASADQTIGIWDAQTGQMLHLLTGHRGSVNSAFFSSDGKNVVSSSSDMTVRVWDALTGKAVRILEGHKEPVSFASFSLVGSQILSCSINGTMIVWNTETGTRIPQYLAGSRSTNAKPVLAFTNSDMGPYIETPPKSGPTTSPQSYFFRVGEDGAALGIRNAWLYFNNKYKFTLGAYLGQHVMLRQRPANEPSQVVGNVSLKPVLRIPLPRQ